MIEVKKDESVMTKEKYVERANKIHNNRYDYEESTFRGVAKMIRVKCPVHGFFHERASSHIRDRKWGCPKCTPDFLYREKQLVVDSARFFAEMKAKYGDTVDYSKAIYLRARTLMIVRCTIHDLEYKVTPENHKNNSGCPTCKKAKFTHNGFKDGFIFGLPADIFRARALNKFRFVHGMKYRYDVSQIQTNNTMMVVTCPTHGDFRVKVNRHTAGDGCPTCEGKPKLVAQYLPRGESGDYKLKADKLK